MPISHHANQPSCQSAIMLISHYISLPSCLSAIMPISHHAYQPSCLSAIMHISIIPISHYAYQPSCPSAIMPISHHAYQPSCLSAIKPISHRAYQPSCLSTLMPVSHWAYHPSEFQDFKTVLQAFQYYLWLLIFSTCLSSMRHNSKMLQNFCRFINWNLYTICVINKMYMIRDRVNMINLFHQTYIEFLNSISMLI